MKKKWTEEKIREVAANFNNRHELNKKYGGAYSAALGIPELLDELFPITRIVKPRGYWSYNKVKKESRKYTSRSEFSKGSRGAYYAALRNGWLNKFSWIKDHRTMDKDPVDCVYGYFLENYHAVYIGRTINRKNRDANHKVDKKDPIARFLMEKEGNLDNFPEMKILEDNITIKQGLALEDYWISEYKNQGWTILNRAKTGVKSGAVGSIGRGKWSRGAVIEEAKKYSSRWSFHINSSGAYGAAVRYKLIDELFPIRKNAKRAVDQFSKDGKFIKIHNSMSEAAEELHIDRRQMWNCCQGKVKTAGGYVFKYHEEQS